jgi:hypothetical protein
LKIFALKLERQTKYSSVCFIFSPSPRKKTCFVELVFVVVAVAVVTVEVTVIMVMVVAVMDTVTMIITVTALIIQALQLIGSTLMVSQNAHSP